MGCNSSKGSATPAPVDTPGTLLTSGEEGEKSPKPTPPNDVQQREEIPAPPNDVVQKEEITGTRQANNIKRVQDLVGEFQAGRPEGYLAGVADNVKASMLGGLIPGADSIENKTQFAKVLGDINNYMEVKKFEPCNWRASGDDVLFNVNWEFVWKATGKTVTTIGLVRKVLKDNMICEKYHMMDLQQVTGEKQEEAESVRRVRELLSEFMAGRPEGYLAGVADDVKADMLGGLIPGADKIQNKAEFAKVMGDIGKYMEVRKFEPCNFRACPNNDMMFNVNWEFVWKATGRVVTASAIVRKVLKDSMICENYHMMDVQEITGARQAANIKRVQDLLADFQAGRPEGYLAGVADNVKASMLGGLIPGADSIENKTQFARVMGDINNYMEVKKFEPCNWRAAGDDVLFNVNWEFVWKATGKTVTTTALVRKVLKDNMICEKYHMMDVEQVTGEKQEEAESVRRVRELLSEFMAGRPEGYLAGVADDVKGDMLGGLIPGADNIQNKAEFAKVMGDIDKYMDILKFEPSNFRACPNNDMMFNVNWEFVWKATGRIVTTTAIVRKVLNDSMICEKYHMVDVKEITDAAFAADTDAAFAADPAPRTTEDADRSQSTLQPTSRVLKNPQGWEEEGILFPHEGVRFLMQELCDALNSMDAQVAWKWENLSAWYQDYFYTTVHHHHDAEEQIYFPWIQSRVAVPAKISQAHPELMQTMDDLREMFKAGASLPVGERSEHLSQVRNSVLLFVEDMQQHLAEEEEVIPPLLREGGFTQDEEGPIVGQIIQGLGLEGNKVGLPPMLHAYARWAGAEKAEAFVSANLPLPIQFLYWNFWVKDFQNRHMGLLASLAQGVDTNPFASKWFC